MCLIEILQHNFKQILPIKWCLIFFKNFFFFKSFLKFFFNKHFQVYLKCCSFVEVINWCLFSYTSDKYYTTLNKNPTLDTTRFLIKDSILLEKVVYINSLITLKRDNSVFKSVNNYNDVVYLNFFGLGRSQSNSFFSKKKTKRGKTPVNQHNLRFFKKSYEDSRPVTPDYRKKRVYLTGNLVSNFFKVDTKALISFNRKILIKFFHFKVKRQYRITRFLSAVIKKKVSASVRTFEMILSNILVLSKLVFNLKQAYSFLKNYLVFLNGICVFKPNIRVSKGDNLQLVLSPLYVDHYMNHFNDLFKLNQKYFNLFKKNTSEFKNKNPKPHVFKSVETLTFFKRSVPKYLEVDFLTFSCYVIYLPLNFYYINNPSNYLYNYYLNRLYNWKFLT